MEKETTFDSVGLPIRLQFLIISFYYKFWFVYLFMSFSSLNILGFNSRDFQAHMDQTISRFVIFLFFFLVFVTLISEFLHWIFVIVERERNGGTDAMESEVLIIYIFFFNEKISVVSNSYISFLALPLICLYIVFVGSSRSWNVKEKSAHFWYALLLWWWPKQSAELFFLLSNIYLMQLMPMH